MRSCAMGPIVFRLEKQKYCIRKDFMYSDSHFASKLTYNGLNFETLHFYGRVNDAMNDAERFHEEFLRKD